MNPESYTAYGFEGTTAVNSSTESNPALNDWIQNSWQGFTVFLKDTSAGQMMPAVLECWVFSESRPAAAKLNQTGAQRHEIIAEL